jgi:hypothetical protein
MIAKSFTLNCVTCNPINFTYYRNEAILPVYKEVNTAFIQLDIVT